jgi:hypothetical protein
MIRTRNKPKRSGLRKGEMCPLHRSFYCCGREKASISATVAGRQSLHGVRLVADQFHPRGYREICSPPELKRRKLKLLAKSQECFYCHKHFDDFRDIDLCHIEPKGMGGARHDDHMDNLALGHHSCNLENGSRRPAA